MSDLDDLAAAARGQRQRGVRVVYVPFAMPPKRRRSGCLSSILVLGVVVGVIWLAARHASDPGPDGGDVVVSRDEKDKIRAELREGVVSGAIHSYDTKKHEVRIDPSLWARLDVEQKQGLVTYYALRFEKLGHGREVQIKSSYSDVVLGEYSAWNGIQIHQ